MAKLLKLQNQSTITVKYIMCVKLYIKFVMFVILYPFILIINYLAFSTL